MNHPDLKTAYHLLGSILSQTQNEKQLKSLFLSNEVNWEEFIKIASSELMLPATYIEIKNKQLLKYTPEDLNSYLEEITNINRNRNRKLLSEAKEISLAFDENQIDHIFIKGIALIAINPLEDIGFRMIGDIDILVDKAKIDHAFQLLISKGYNDLRPFNYEIKDYRHYPRQISKEKFGAVELHRNLLTTKTNNLLDASEILTNKRYYSGLPVPNQKDAIKIAIYTTQINDKCQSIPNVKFKSTYDSIILGLNTQSKLFHDLKGNTFFKLFTSLSSIYFEELKPLVNYKDKPIKYIIFKFFSKRPQSKRILISSLTKFQAVNERLHLFTTNKSYRKHILLNKILNNKP
ncbi:nucleotidyltransferase family protein [Mangrovimonas futianensis]|uniref:nucleotidyltransferase family protein n=1 Tax=Mangrovimonas futianensis TaxID=2895523 RepID=UPI001E2FF2C3|nr:nucleotidyltransferase family protein [Mangrovimonas futianensis]MCF1420269.1 nucleotidyltransferase family protein [Mangrovimonas futianensis]